MSSNSFPSKGFILMTQSDRLDIREVLLAEIKARQPSGYTSAPLHQKSILDAVAKRLNANQRPDIEEAILTQWHDLFRTGLLAWGLNLSNPDPPFFHLAERGRQALVHLERNPSNPAGYLRHLASIAELESVSMSYLVEGLECYAAGLFKAASVMVGGAAEKTVLNLRDLTVQKLKSLETPVPKKMEDWRIKVITDALYVFFEGQAVKFERPLYEVFEAYWPAFTQQIRATRNDAGHPTSVDPVTPDTVHASLLIFPELAKLADSLQRWVISDLK
jgi:hypothetical protein